jgi:hypothetical protein
VGAGLLFFGKDLFSYAFSSGRMLKTAVKDTIPVQFEIQRARDLLEDLIPEMHANLRLVAEEEVEVASLEKKVVKEREWVAGERSEIQRLRKDLDVRPAAYAAGEGRDSVDQLSQKFERFRTRELLLSGNEKLLQNRRRTLNAAIQRLEKTRLARVELAAQIEGLEGQFHLLQAQGSSCDLRLNDTKLAQTQRLLGDLKKRLEVAQRVLEREASITDPSPAPSVTPERLKDEIDTHFSTGGPKPTPESVSAPFWASLIVEAPTAAGSAR